jgi:predicted DCC family thiol-disulfide oxidoreductase YuxK
VVVERGGVYTKSTAALRIVRRVGGLWPALYALIVVPRPVRDFAYDWFARRRYRWFGKRDECMVPSPEVRERFLTDEPSPPTAPA